MLADWQWENAVAGSAAGLATVSFSHPLDVVRTRFQVNDGRLRHLPTYKNTPHALITIARTEGFRGLYAGFYPAVLGSTISWGLYFFFYSKAKQRYLRSREELSPSLHLASAAEAGALVCCCTNPIWLVKTRLQLQTPEQARPYSGFHDALKTILREEGWKALYKGLVPGLFLITHGAIQFTAYEELRKMIIRFRTTESERSLNTADNSLNFGLVGCYKPCVPSLGRRKMNAISPKALAWSYPEGDWTKCLDRLLLNQIKVHFSSQFPASNSASPSIPKVIRARLQQRPTIKGIPRYIDSWHVAKETARFEGLRGFYKGITANVLKNAPAASVTFIVYENVLNMLKLARRKDI